MTISPEFLEFIAGRPEPLQFHKCRRFAVEPFEFLTHCKDMGRARNTRPRLGSFYPKKKKK